MYPWLATLAKIVRLVPVSIEYLRHRKAAPTATDGTATAERLADIEWPTADEEIWRYSRIGDLDLARYRPMRAEELGQPGIDAVPGGGPVAAELGSRAGLIVVRDGRVVHHELDPALAARGVVVGGLATLAPAAIADTLGATSDASPDAFTQLHDAFLAGGQRVGALLDGHGECGELVSNGQHGNSLHFFQKLGFSHPLERSAVDRLYSLPRQIWGLARSIQQAICQIAID